MKYVDGSPKGDWGWFDQGKAHRAQPGISQYLQRPERDWPSRSRYRQRSIRAGQWTQHRSDRSLRGPLRFLVREDVDDVLIHSLSKTSSMPADGPCFRRGLQSL